MEFTDDFRGYFRVGQYNVSERAKSYVAGMLMKAPRKNIERMSEYLPDCDYQSQQQFLSDSPWEHRPLLDRVAREASALLGGAGSTLAIDESCFAKKGECSAGVARQWNGRLGKTDNCQVGVFAALSDGRGAVPIDFELYLPEEWTGDELRCAKARIPDERRRFRTKIELARDLIDRAQANGVDFGCVALDALYGSSPWLLRHIEDSGKLFAADARCDQIVYAEDPRPYLPRRSVKSGRKFSRLRARGAGCRIGELFEPDAAGQWKRVKLREGAKGPVRVLAARRRVWLWDGKEREARCWWAVCVIDAQSGERKHFLSNAPRSASLASLARMRGDRYWIERCFQDGKTSAGMADYQVRGWLAWHHHMALNLLAQLFMLRERRVNLKEIELLSCQDIVELLNFYMPRADLTERAVLENMRRRHRQRKRDIENARKRPKPWPTATAST